MDINTNLLILNIKHLVGTLLGVPFGSTDSYIMLGVVVLVLGFLGNLINSILNGNSRGMILSFIGLVMPIAVAITAYSLAFMYAGPMFDSQEAMQTACMIASGALGLFTLAVITPFFLATGFVKSAVVFVLTIICVAVSLHFTSKGIASFEVSKETLSDTGELESIEN